MPKKLLLLELNELCPSLLGKWMDTGRLPNFKRFHDHSQVYLTVADAEPPALEPWIQWYSIHTGLSFAQHRVFRLTEGSRAGHDDIWTVLQRAGLKTANCSSLNAKGSAARGCFFLPDPWSSDARAFPHELVGFHRFVSAQVREHTNRANGLNLRDALAFSGFLAAHGLQLQTVAKVLSQLCREAVSRRDSSWRRVALLDIIQADVFMSYFHTMKPDFSTFFLNSTAHLQHAFWRYMDPDAFDSTPNAEERRTYGDAVLYGYQSMDRLLARFFDLEKEGVTLALATGLSQKAFLEHEDAGGQKFYRPRDFAQLLDLLGFCPQSVDPVMAHEYVLRFETPGDRAVALDILQRVVCLGEKVFDVQIDGGKQLYLGSRLQIDVPSDAVVYVEGSPGNCKPFYDIFYLIDERKSGCHDPEGLLWFKVGHPKVHSQRVSILDIFPTVLEFMGIEYRPSEGIPFAGRSLVMDWNGT